MGPQSGCPGLAKTALPGTSRAATLPAVELGGSPEEIRAVARRVRGWAVSTDAAADRLRSGLGVQWVSTAAERFRDRLVDHTRAVHGSRDELLELARDLENLADTLEERQAAIRRAAALVEDALDGARRTLGRLWGIAREELSDAERNARRVAEEILDTVGDTPPVGSPDWLELSRKLGHR